MSEPKPILQYERPVPGSQHLALMETAKGFALVFPLPPRWLLWFTPSACAVVAMMTTLGSLRFAKAVWNVGVGSAGGSPLWLVAVVGCIVCFWWALAAYQFVLMRTWSQVPSRLVVEDGELILAEQGFWGMRRRQWSLYQIQRVDVRPIRAMLTREKVVDLHIHLRSGRPLRLRLATANESLPGRVVQLLQRHIQDVQDTQDSGPCASSSS